MILNERSLKSLRTTERLSSWADFAKNPAFTNPVIARNETKWSDEAIASMVLVLFVLSSGVVSKGVSPPPSNDGDCHGHKRQRHSLAITRKKGVIASD